MPADHGDRLAELLPQGQLRIIDDAYVLVMLDQPERTAQAIGEFLKLTSPSCRICAKTSTTPQVSATFPSTKRKMKISS